MWNAADYHEQSAAQAGWARELSQKLFLRGDEHLLDLGCGTGRITAGFAEQLLGGYVVGIDSSADMIDFATRTYAGYPNLAFHCMDAIALDLPQRFDVVFSNAVMHWIKDHATVLRRVSDHLKPGGRILFQMGGRGNAADVLSTMQEVMARPGWRDYFANFESPYSFYAPADYEPWLAAANLRPERVELIAKDMQQDGPAGLLGWLRTTWFPFANQVPAAQRDHFLNEVLTTYLSRHPLDPAGKAHVAMVRLEVEATAG